jgi:K+-sensing histidine kinase KdpD
MPLNGLGFSRHAAASASGAVVLAVVLGFADYVTGEEPSFFVFYFLPIAVAAWAAGMATSLILSVVCAGIWFAADWFTGHRYSTGVMAAWNVGTRLVSFLSIGFVTARLHVLRLRDRERVETLRALLPICASCHRIRDDRGYWQQVEEYVEKHFDVRFSHGLCRECTRKLFPDLHVEQEARPTPPEERGDARGEVRGKEDACPPSRE